MRRFSSMLGRRQRALGAVLVASTALAMSACGGSDDSGTAEGGTGAYTVSMIGDMSGAVAAIVSHGIGGFETAISAINDAGGVNGRKIEFGSPIDARSTPEGAQQAIREAIGQEPMVVFMTTTSTEVAGIAPVATGAGVTLLTVANDDGQAVPPKPHYYSATLSSTAAGTAYANAIEAELGTLSGKNIAMIVSNSVSTIAYGEKLQELVEAAGGRVSSFVKNDPSVPSFATQAGQIMQDVPDAIMLNDSPTNTVVEVTALKAAGYTGAIFGGTAANDDATLQKTAELGVDYRGPREFNTPVEGDEAWTAAVKYGHEEAAKAGIYFSKGYMLGYALAAGLERCGADCDAASLPAAMAEVTDVSAPGDIPIGKAGFTEDSHVVEQDIQFFTYDQAQSAVVPTGDPASVID